MKTLITVIEMLLLVSGTLAQTSDNTATPPTTTTTTPSPYPVVFDWRTQIELSPVQNQGPCFSYYAFGAAETVEAAYSIFRNQDLILSKQQLVDCSAASWDKNYTNSGCNGGSVPETFEYFVKHGVVEEEYYPYNAKFDEKCFAASLTVPEYKIQSYGQLPYNSSDEDLMEALMEHGPLAVYIYSNTPEFLTYNGGVIQGVLPQTPNWDHVVVLVGWGWRVGIDYWLLRNSWGEEWGEFGYVRVERHSNLLGINNYVYYPILD